jgi:hypothetical protein
VEGAEKMNSEFSRVGTLDYYGEYDGLGGFTLVDGEEIEIKFPNGKIERQTVRVDKGTGTAQIDMNMHPDHFPTSEAYVIRDIQGCLTKFWLRNADVMVRRLDEPVDKSAHRFWNGKWNEEGYQAQMERHGQAKDSFFGSTAFEEGDE